MARKLKLLVLLQLGAFERVNTADRLVKGLDSRIHISHSLIYQVVGVCFMMIMLMMIVAMM